jgi:hypothetical protein
MSYQSFSILCTSAGFPGAINSSGIVTLYRATDAKSAESFVASGVSLSGGTMVLGGDGLWTTIDHESAWYWAIANVPVVDTRVIVSFGLSLSVINGCLADTPPSIEWYPQDLSVQFLPQSFELLNAHRTDVQVQFLE